MTLMLAVAPVAPVAPVAAVALAVALAAVLAVPDDDWLEPPPADAAALDAAAAVFFDELHALIPRIPTPTRTPARTHIGRDTEDSLLQGGGADGDTDAFTGP